MSEVEIAVGDAVRIHFHPPGAIRSYCEGVVSRVDVTTEEGRFFVVEVMHEVLLDREHRIRRGFPDFVRYKYLNDFPGRIEVLCTAPHMEQESSVDLTLMEPLEVTKQVANELPPIGSETYVGIEVEQIPEAEASTAPNQEVAERQPPPVRGGLIAALFGRKER